MGDGQARALEALEGAQQRQQAALAAANAAQQTADADAALATEAKAAADAAVAEHRGALQQAEQAVSTTRKATAGADGEAALLAAADAYAGGAGGAGGNGVTGPVGSCTGGDVSAFPNGRIPLSLLCPVWGAPGAYLRADAEYAFDRLSHAYAKAFGTPICVTDAYRSYPDQVRVAAERPGFAAKPGTSNHGWGTADGPVRRHRVVRHRDPPVDARERAAVRLVPPVLGRADRLAARSPGTGSSAADRRARRRCCPLPRGTR